ncbi:hypothetical protein RHMOL_Rhmol05G0318800 [Rhododendron molle]|uniref:Uncharacterized protein n=1 Tax=Rhododendron molle TaxID=49168 RepID=A0ACC0NV80_RHOML|nr:hypothetical protein RHMOL_Rhmol05G0318800 [Rhododendron molle]
MQEVEKMSMMLSNQRVGIEEGPDTKLIPDCFALREAIAIDTFRLHKFMNGKYCSRFPNVDMELLGPAPYARAVQKIENEMDLANATQLVVERTYTNMWWRKPL